MKKTILIILALLVTSSTLAYATIQYSKQTTIEHEVTIGNTIETVDGLIITPYNLEQGNLIFLSQEETTTDKHELTYIYDYTIVEGIYNIQVTSLTQDIVITSYTVGDRISITFQLNQEMDFVSGSTLQVGFLFELVDVKTISDYTRADPFYINQANYYEMVGVVINETLARQIIDERELNGYFTSVQDVDYRLGTMTFADRFNDAEVNGIISFE
jgi:DNA uptake protein ComE-like DNA-binding protein